MSTPDREWKFVIDDERDFPKPQRGHIPAHVFEKAMPLCTNCKYLYRYPAFLAKCILGYRHVGQHRSVEGATW